LTYTPTSTPTRSPTHTPTATPTPSPAPPQTIHVGDLEGSAKEQGASWQAEVIITVHGADHEPVQGVNVAGSWFGGVSGWGLCMTEENGQCSVVSGAIDPGSAATFRIDDLLYASYTYLPAANHDLDGDSDGTQISVNRNLTATPTPSATPASRRNYLPLVIRS
jgi:hypothetical protein